METTGKPTRIRVIAIACIVGIAVVVLLFLFVHLSSNDETYVEGSDLQTSEIAGNTGIVSSTNTVRADYSFTDYCDNAEFICVGEFLGFSDSFLIEPLNDASPQYFTDMYFKVYARDALVSSTGSLPEAYSGEITVRQMGGHGDVLTTVNDSFAEPTVGETYLLFLYRIYDGSEYNTEGDHYYLLGGSGGMWKCEDGFQFLNASGSEGASESEVALATNKVAYVGEDVASEKENYRAQYVKDIQEQYDNGEISYELYANVMADEDLYSNNFARIMSKEEEKSYEASLA